MGLWVDEFRNGNTDGLKNHLFQPRLRRRIPTVLDEFQGHYPENCGKIES